MTIEATAWKITLDKRAKECKYTIQIDNIDGRSEGKIEKLFEDWRSTGSGHSATTGSIMLFYTKDFGDAKSWVDWAKDFPYKLVELTQSDKEKVLSWGQKTVGKTKKVKTGGRRCGKCGDYGHNRRRCGNLNKDEVKAKKKRKKRVEKGPRKCGKCGATGHNSRTCDG